MVNSNRTAPERINDNSYRFDLFGNGEVLHNKKKQHLPAMGWNSWNAFGSGNNEELTGQMADRLVELGLDKLGYRYIVLDDGCYLNERVDGKLANNPERFPSGFRALADRLHSMGLKFGMYNDIGINLCAGAAVGTCGHEQEDAASYAEWDVDFLKVDNCYYLWDNATFSDARNARYVFAPAISELSLSDDKGSIICRCTAGAASDKSDGRTTDNTPEVTGSGITVETIGGAEYYAGIGTFDGTGPMHSPVGDLSGELRLNVSLPQDGTYFLTARVLCGEQDGRGSWLQVAVGEGAGMRMLYDDMILPENEDAGADDDVRQPQTFRLALQLGAGHSVIRLMNHRRQENTLTAYARLLEGLNEARPGHDIIYSMCEWGKTQPHGWAPKVGDSWRILNDITFDVGADGRHGSCDWQGGYTNNITAQYNKCVIMDEFSGLDRGWNDPDMMVIGMDKLSLTQYRTHMTMWCMMNSPLMLGLDLRRVDKGDELYGIIANRELIALDQDPLGIQAKRIFSSAVDSHADTAYITDIHRVDILAKPLADGSVALSFINVSDEPMTGSFSVEHKQIMAAVGHRMSSFAREAFLEAGLYNVRDLWTGKESINDTGIFTVNGLEACDNVTYRITPLGC